MIDLIYKTLQVIINKEQNGYVSPTEYNILANNTQQEIFRSYFEDENRDKNKQNKNLTNRGYANLPFNERQRINQFSATANITSTDGDFTLPSDLYFIEDKGVTSGGAETYPNRVIEEIERSRGGYLYMSEVKASELYPVYENNDGFITVSPIEIEEIKVKYLRKPKTPNWTFFPLSSGDPLYNPSDPAFQDFELHNSEFSKIVIKMLSYFGINLREGEVLQIAETLKDKLNITDNA